MNTKSSIWKVFILSLAGSLLVACATIPGATTPEPSQATPEAGLGLPNPASVYCQEQGGRLEIRTDASSGQSGVCVFSDGSECDEWAYFRGECSPAYPDESQADASIQPETETIDITDRDQNSTQPVIAWVGHISSSPSGSQYDDFLSLMPDGAGEVGISGFSAEVEAQLVALRDGTGVEEFPMLWGELACDVPDYGGCQLLVREVRYGQIQVDPAPVDGWLGSVACSHFNSSPSNLCGNAFVLDGDFPIWYGLWSANPDVLAQIEQLRDTDQTI